jgi:hypothetical protein
VGRAELGGYTLSMSDRLKPSEKGDWAATADAGVVPPELSGSDSDPDFVGETTGSDTPATASGVDRAGGDAADAVTDGGVSRAAEGEPDLKDAAAMPRKVDEDSAA